MNFVQSTFLLALAGLAVPVIIHLIHRRQTRRVSLGTTRFLTDLLQQTARHRRMKRWLLLSLRLLMVAVLVILFARPYLQARQSGAARKQAVFLIDQSASMSLRSDGQRLVDLAVGQVRELIEAREADTDFEVAFFDHDLHVVTPASAIEGSGSGHAGNSAGALLSAFKTMQAPATVYGATRFSTALTWAREMCLKSTASHREVYLFTDLQRSGFDWMEVSPFPEDVDVHVRDLGREAVNHVAVNQAVPSTVLLRPGEEAKVTVALQSFGPLTFTDIPALLTLRQGGRTIHRTRKVSLTSGQLLELEFDVPPLDAGLWEGTLTLDVDDELAFDNRAVLALLVAKQSRVLLVDGERETDTGHSDSFFLERAIGLARHGEQSDVSPFAVETISQAELLQRTNLQDVDLVVLTNVGGLSENAAEMLTRFVSAGSGMLILTGNHVTPESTRTLRDAGLMPGEIGEIVRTQDLPFRWERWETQHPLLAPFADPQSGDLQRFSFQAYTRLLPDETAQVLARFAGGDPALTSHELGRGRVLWFLSGCDRNWGDWTRSRLFLPLVHQMLGDLVHLTGGGPVQSHLLDDWDLVLGKAGAALPRHPGVIEHQGRWHVFNTNPNESETERGTAQELAERFRFRLVRSEENVSPASIEAAEVTKLETRPNEIWPWCAGLLLGLFCLEYFMGNRTTI